jgi:hypothetical protein
MMDLLTEYKMYIGGALGGLALGWPWLKNLVGKIKLPSFKAGVEVEDLEVLDQESIKHLRDRAVSIGDKDLIGLIKSIDGKFFDVHVNKGSK